MSEQQDGGDPSAGIKVAHEELSTEALRGVVESFVLREGTDYTHRNVSLESKVSEVMEQIENGEAYIVYDPHSASVDVVTG